MTPDPTRDPRVDATLTHGPYCALCGECKACWERDPYPMYPRCPDNDGQPHLWNRSN